MSTQVETHRIQMYKNNVEHLLQVVGGRLTRACTTDTYQGKGAKVVEQIGLVTAQKNTTRHANTPLANTPAEARWIFPDDYDVADLIDDQDKLRMIIDLSSPYAEAQAKAINRARDAAILTAAFGAALTGENGTTSTTLPTSTSTNVVSVDTGGSASNLNVTKLKRAKRLLMANNVDVEMDELFVMVDAVAHEALLSDIQFVSMDFNRGGAGMPVLKDGMLDTFLGFKFIHTQLLADSTLLSVLGTTDDQAGTSTPVACWAKSGMHFGTWGDLQVSMDRRPDKRNAMQVYSKSTFGATRLQEGKVVKIWCR